MTSSQLIPDEILTFGCRILGASQSKANVMLAGGAIRDALNGKEVKDYDFFIDKRYMHSIINYIHRINGYPYKIKGSERGILCDEGEYKFSVVNVKIENFDKPVQLIFVDDYYSVLSKFDIGLCQIGFSFNTGALLKTEAYKEDVENKTITVFKDNLKPNTDHEKRVRDKYPNHKVIYV